MLLVTSSLWAIYTEFTLLVNLKCNVQIQHDWSVGQVILGLFLNQEQRRLGWKAQEDRRSLRTEQAPLMEH